MAGCWKGYRQKHERPRKACGKIHSGVAVVGVAEAIGEGPS